jgi:hypothetical protein
MVNETVSIITSLSLKSLAIGLTRAGLPSVVELQAVPDFDYVVVNDDLDECVSKIRNIVEGQEPPAFHEQDAEQMRREIVELLEGYYNMYRQDSE